MMVDLTAAGNHMVLTFQVPNVDVEFGDLTAVRIPKAYPALRLLHVSPWLVKVCVSWASLFQIDGVVEVHQSFRNPLNPLHGELAYAASPEPCTLASHDEDVGLEAYELQQD